MKNLKLKFKKALKIAFVALIGLAVLGYFVGKDKEKNTKEKLVENKRPQNSYQSYLNSSQHAINQLNPERKATREKLLTELKTNLIYKILVDSGVVSMEYMPCLSAIATGISYSNDEGFSITEALAKHIKNSNNGADKMIFVSKVTALVNAQNGGVPKEIIEIFDRYKQHYKLYAEKGIHIGVNGKQETITVDYDISPFFGMIDPKNTDILDKIYEAKQKGLSGWSNVKNANYPYLAAKAEYMNYLKQVYPESPYILKVDAELTASELYRAYNANEVAADERYKNKKLAVTGIVGDISKDFMGDGKVSLEVGFLQTISCNFGENTKVISKLSKGDKITIVGTCEGFVVKQVVMDNCEIWE